MNKEFMQFEITQDVCGVFEAMMLPQELTNRTVIDIGSNDGSASFESLRRGASRVIGLQPSRERVENCRQKADRLGWSDRCEFHEVNLRRLLTEPGLQDELAELHGQADVVFCSGEYVDSEGLCDLLTALTTEVCYLDMSTGMRVSQLTACATTTGFTTVTSHDVRRSFLRRRSRLAILDKKILLSERLWQRRYRGFRLGERCLKKIVSPSVWERFSLHYWTPNSQYDHRSFRLGDRYIREFASRELWNKVRTLYARIAHIPYVQECEFSVPGRLTSPMYAKCLMDAALTEDDKARIRRQVVTLICELNRAGVAHRDIHCGNFFLDGGQIRLVDLEYLEVDTRPLHECYDLTGRGLPCPLKSGWMNAFKDYYRSLKTVIGLTPRDFGLTETAGCLSQARRSAA